MVWVTGAAEWRRLVSLLGVVSGLCVAACGDDADDDASGAGARAGAAMGGGGGRVGGAAGAGAAAGASVGGRAGGTAQGGAVAMSGRGGSGGAGGMSGGRDGSGGTAGNGALGGTSGTSGDAGEAGTDSGPPPIEEPDLPAPGASITREAQGEVVIKTDAEAALFCASFDGVRGSLRVTGSTIENLDALSCLVEVTGQLELSAYSLKHAELPNLVAVGTLLVVTQNALEDILMPKLAFTRNELRIVTTGLSEVALPALTSVGEELTIAAITTLDTIELPALTWVGNQIDFSNSNLREVDVTNLVYVGADLRLRETALEHLSLLKLRQTLGVLSVPGGSYADIDLSALERADGGIALGGDETSSELVTLDFPRLEVAGIFGASGFANLERVSAPRLVQTKSLALGPAPLLTSVSFPLLEDAGSLTLEELGDSAELEFPELTTASAVRVRLAGRGVFELPKLVQVSSLDVNGALEVNLPALETIERTGVFGDYANAGPLIDCEVSLPKLASAVGLEFRAGPKGDLDLPALVDLTDLHLTSTGFESVSIDALTSVRVVRVAENAALTTLSFDALESAEDANFGDTALTTLALPKLASSEKYLGFGVPVLAELDLPALATAYDLQISGSGLTTLNVPALDDVFTFHVYRSGLESLEAPGLTQLYELILEDNPLLTSVNFAAESSTFNLRIVANPLLETLVVSQPSDAGDLYIDENPKLENLDGLTAASRRALDITITNNVGLTRITGLGPVEIVLGDVTIYGNPALSADAVNDFLASITDHQGDVILMPP